MKIFRFLFVVSILALCKLFDFEMASAVAGMPFLMGDITTHGIREREDLSSVIDVLKQKDDDMKYLSFVNFLPSIVKNFGKKVTAQKHEWLDDAARAEYVTIATGSDGAGWDTTDEITTLPMATAECAKLRVGDVLLLDQDEVVVVSAITTADQDISVYARGHGSTTAAVLAHNATHIAYIIGNAQIENGDPLASNFTAMSAGYNYTQIFEDVAQISGTVRRSALASGDELDRQVIKKIKELMRSLNYSLVEGIRDLDTTNLIGTMGGLREFITNISNVAGALTVANLYTAVISHVNAGLYPSAIHGSPTTIGKLEQLYQGAVRTKVSDKRGGTEINVVVILGYEIELHVDKHVRSSEALILDYNRIGYGPLDGGKKGQSGEFASYPIWDKINGKQIATQVLGEYTMRVSNGGGTRMYGIT